MKPPPPDDDPHVRYLLEMARASLRIERMILDYRDEHDGKDPRHITLKAGMAFRRLTEAASAQMRRGVAAVSASLSDAEQWE